MTPLTPLDALHQALAEQTAAIAAMLPTNRAGMLRALLRAEDRIAPTGAQPPAHPSWNLALRLCLGGREGASRDIPADDAERFLTACDLLASASLIAAQAASGHLHLAQPAPRTFVAWAMSRRISAEQRERDDFDWWTAHLTRQVAPRIDALFAERDRIAAHSGRTGDDAAIERIYREIGHAQIARFAAQHSYPADAAIGGATFGRYSDILALLIGWLYRERDDATADRDVAPVSRDERVLIAALADALNADLGEIGQALQPFIFDADNAAYHSALPGSAAPPVIRLDAQRVALSARGLLGEPFIFLARELRRRHAQEYHNSAHLREGVFRRDLYRLFADRRFAVSAGRVELKRQGEARTDLDALVFDRKTGTLGVFELKAQDPFARSVEERLRQRENFYHANRQVSAILAWVQRHGADDLLNRFDERAAKRFRVQKVHLFVLGRYLAHFTGGPEPDRRAAWGSWPQLLHLVGDGRVIAESRNPLDTLFTRLRDATPLSAPTDADRQTIVTENFRLRVYPTFADMRTAEDHLGGT